MAEGFITRRFTPEPPTYIDATGGTILEYDSSGKRYRSHTFTSDGNFVVNQTGNGDRNQVEYLIVAGGGSSASYSAGGGAGGYRSSVQGELSGGGVDAEPRLTVSEQTYEVVVGAGGAGPAPGFLSNDGQNSSFAGITSIGGGGAGLHNPISTSNGGTNSNLDRIGRAGGSSGGSGRSAEAPTTAVMGQGYNGGCGSADNGSTCQNTGSGNPKGGGGGGAGSAGSNATSTNGGDGGIGVSSIIRTGSPEFRAGGGAGHSFNGPGGTGGNGGGGNGASNDVNEGSPGTANTGGGGGGSSSNEFGASGGSGIVIIRYEIAPSV